MDFHSWLHYVQDQGLLLTPSNFQSAENHEIEVVSVDYLWFLAYEYAERYNIKYNQNYSPKIIFEQHRQKLKLNLSPKISPAPVLQENGSAKMEDVCFFEAKMTDNTGEYDISLYLDEDGTICSGNADGFTRYVEWKNLNELDLPEFYFEELESDNE